MAHPLQDQVVSRLARSSGHAVGWRPLAQRAVLSVMLGLSLVSAINPAFAAQPLPATQDNAAMQSQHGAVQAWWGEHGVGFDRARFKLDMQARGFSADQAVSVYQWMDHLDTPTFGVGSPSGETAQGLSDRAGYAQSLTEAVNAGPVQFDAWQQSTIDDLRGLIVPVIQSQDEHATRLVMEYLDGLGIHQTSAVKLVDESRWGNEGPSWSRLDAAIDRDVGSREFPVSTQVLSMEQAHGNLDQAARDVGLRWFRAPAALMHTPQDIQAMADMLHQVNANLSQKTGLHGPVLGLNGRVAWDMGVNPNENFAGDTNEHTGGICIRGSQQVIAHEFSHALGAAMNPKVGVDTVDASMHALLGKLQATQLPYTPKINAERWDGFDMLARHFKLSNDEIKWVHDTRGSREDIRTYLGKLALEEGDASYLASTAAALHDQDRSKTTLAFVAYRQAILSQVAKDDPSFNSAYFFNEDEVVAYQAQYRLQPEAPIDTWRTPTATEMVLQDGAWKEYYAIAQKWQQQDLAASAKHAPLHAAIHFGERLASRRGMAAPAELPPAPPRPASP